MTHRQVDEILRRLKRIAEDYLVANGYQVVTEDKKIFPYVEPALAALRDGRLLVFSIKEFPSASQFLRPEELIHIRDDLKEFVEANTPDSDARVSRVETVALVMTPEEITVAAPVGDIKWLMVKQEDEVPDALDKLSL